MKPFRCGLIGFGMMGKNHARVIRELPGMDLVVVAEKSGVAEGLGDDVLVVRDVDEALSLGIDCAIISVPTKNHEEVAVACAQAGIPALIEKPLADSVESARRIESAFQDAGVYGAVGHIERFNPALKELKKRLSGGELGEIFQISTRRQSSFPGRISDVGVVKDLATHDIDIVLGLTGSAYQEVYALASHKSGRENEDMIIASCRLENGIIVSHLVNWLSPLKERVTAVTGELGMFVADTLTGDLTLYRNGQFDIDWESLSSFRGVSEGDVTRFAFDRKEPLKAEIEAFIAHLSGSEGRDLTDLSAGLRVLQVAERMLGVHV